jgi:hypothetical protein
VAKFAGSKAAILDHPRIVISYKEYEEKPHNKTIENTPTILSNPPHALP